VPYTDDDGNSQTYTSNDYGLFVADGNVARFEGGAEFVDSNYYIKQDAALIIKDTDDRIVAKFGSVGSGDVGMIMGFTGADLDTPVENDRRTYVDNDEFAIEEYTGGAWNTDVNAVRVGGTDSNDVFYLRGIL